MENSGSEAIYVRGGARYYFYTTKNVLPVLRTSDYTDSGQTISPKAAADMTNADYSTLKRTMVETSDTNVSAFSPVPDICVLKLDKVLRLNQPSPLSTQIADIVPSSFTLCVV